MFDLLSIKGPSDVKAVPAEHVGELYDAMRRGLIVRASKHGSRKDEQQIV